MTSYEANDFLAGVIEGFYGQPWTQAERFELFDWMVRWGLNTYFYAPKDDLKQRAIWRENYSVAEAETLRQLIQASQQRSLRFIYALSRRVWELREELDLLDRFVQFKSKPGNTDAAFTSDFHLPGTYRGGFVAQLQRLFPQPPDLTFPKVAAETKSKP